MLFLMSVLLHAVVVVVVSSCVVGVFTVDDDDDDEDKADMVSNGCKCSVDEEREIGHFMCMRGLNSAAVRVVEDDGVVVAGLGTV
jgi:hypothetical protein